MKCKIILAIFYIIFSLSPSLLSEEIDRESLNVVIWMDKHKFFKDEPVLLKMSVKNISSAHVSFDIWEKSGSNQPDYITFQPVVFDKFGKEAEIIIPYRLENKSVQDIIQGFGRRKITLGPGEELIQTINMNGVYKLIPGEKFRVKGYFFPYSAQNIALVSGNVLNFHVSGESKLPDRYFASEIRHEVSPPEVVLLALNAEKNRNWERMLKYFDVEKYINSYSEYVRAYNLANEIDKKNIINGFIKFLSRDRDDYLLDFKFRKDEFDAERKVAYVNVFVERFSPGMKDIYEYRYTLEKYKNLWLIINLEASIIKGIE